MSCRPLLFSGNGYFSPVKAEASIFPTEFHKGVRRHLVERGSLSFFHHRKARVRAKRDVLGAAPTVACRRRSHHQQDSGVAGGWPSLPGAPASLPGPSSGGNAAAATGTHTPCTPRGAPWNRGCCSMSAREERTPWGLLGAGTECERTSGHTARHPLSGSLHPYAAGTALAEVTADYKL